MIASSLPTIILVGGPFTDTEGTRLDSRQPLVDDPSSQVFSQALMESRHWWRVVQSIANPLLREAGSGAAGIIQGARSVIEATATGEHKRTRLRGLFGGAVGELSVRPLSPIDGSMPEGHDNIGTFAKNQTNHDRTVELAMRKQPSDAQWYFLDRGSYILPSADVLGAVLTVGASALATHLTPDKLTAHTPFLADFERNLMLWQGKVVIAPDTANSRAVIDAYFDWISQGRSTRRGMSAIEQDYDPTSPEPMQYLKVIPAAASFGVTALVRGGQWANPAPLEAARALLESRYDYQFGLWDLTDNAPLRRMLLAETPVSPVPDLPAEIPAGAARKAQGTARSKVVLHHALQDIVEMMTPTLTTAGWIRDDDKWRRMLTLHLTEPFARWHGGPPMPLAMCVVDVLKRQTQVRVRGWGGQDGIGGTIEAKRGELQSVCPATLGSFRDFDAVVWKAQGGHADEVDWVGRAKEIANATATLRLALSDYVAALRADNARTRER
jgi:hypothetical protein